MYTRTAIIAGALLLVIAALSAFSTNPAVGTGHRAWNSTNPSTPATGRIMGQVGDSLGAGGARYVSFASNSTGGGGMRLAIYSKDIANADKVDTMGVVGSWDGRFARGVDSVYIVNAAAGVTLSATTSQ